MCSFQGLSSGADIDLVGMHLPTAASRPAARQGGQHQHFFQHTTAAPALFSNTPQLACSRAASTSTFEQHTTGAQQAKPGVNHPGRTVAATKGRHLAAVLHSISTGRFRKADDEILTLRQPRSQGRCRKPCSGFDKCSPDSRQTSSGVDTVRSGVLPRSGVTLPSTTANGLDWTCQAACAATRRRSAATLCRPA